MATMKSAPSASASLVGDASHIEQINVHLDVISYLLSKSPLRLNGDLASKLWDALFTSSVVPEEEQAFCVWLKRGKVHHHRHHNTSLLTTSHLISSSSSSSSSPSLHTTSHHIIIKPHRITSSSSSSSHHYLTSSHRTFSC